MRQGRAGAMSGWWPGVSEERGERSRPTRADAGRPRPVPRSLARRGGRAVSVICLLSIQVALVAALAVLEAAPPAARAALGALAAVAAFNASLHLILAALARKPAPPAAPAWAPGRVAAGSLSRVSRCAPCGAPRDTDAARHCTPCGACVPRDARHCVFMGTCVGATGPGARHFALTLFWLFAGGALGVAISAWALVARRREVAALLADAAYPLTPFRLATALPRALLAGPPWVVAAYCLGGACATAAAAVGAVGGELWRGLARPRGESVRSRARALFGGARHPAFWLLPPWGADGGGGEGKRD